MDNISGTFSPSFVSNRRKQGFTLIEAMVTIAIVAILSAIALPSMSSFLVKMRVDNEVIEVQRLLLTARNAAINSGQNSQLCPLKANDTCKLTTNWTGRIGVVSADGLIKEKAAIHTGDKLNFSSQSITYDAAGRSDNVALITFSYCPKDYSDFSRGISLSISGRSYLSSDINGNGKDQDRAGASITCP